VLKRIVLGILLVVTSIGVAAAQAIPGNPLMIMQPPPSILLTQANIWLGQQTFVAPVLGAATATTLAIGGATLGSNALAVTGMVSISSTLQANIVTVASPSSSGFVDISYNQTGSLGNPLVNLAGILNTSGSPTIIKVAITDQVHGASTEALQILGGASATTNLLSVDMSGNITSGGRLTVGSYLRTAGYTVASLPASPGAGAIAYVTDAVTCTFLAALTGGGSTFCPVTFNGTAWNGG
jgi:hypothetical protein